MYNNHTSPDLILTYKSTALELFITGSVTAEKPSSSSLVYIARSESSGLSGCLLHTRVVLALWVMKVKVD